MGDVKYEQPQDESEVEISDIDELENSVSRKGLHPSKKPARSPLRTLFSPQLRWLQLISSASIVVLALLIILGSTSSVRNLALGVFFPPAPTPIATLEPGTDLFYVQGNPPWGHLSIDGHAVSHLPIFGIDSPLRLSSGHHVLTWSAEPFMAQSCTLSIPANFGTDTCSDNQALQGESGFSGSIITFSVSLNTLPDAQRISLIQATQAALDAGQSIDTVQPGELYVLSSACRLSSSPMPRCFVAAKQPLRAILSFQLDTDVVSNASCSSPGPSPCTLQNQNCHLFCPDLEHSSSTMPGWDVFAPVRSLWEFATFGGQILAHGQSDTTVWDYATGQVGDENLVPLHITWDNLGWHVTIPSNTQVNAPIPGLLDLTCAPAQSVVGFLGDATLNNVSIPLQWRFTPDTALAAGCVAVATSALDTTATPTPSSSPALRAYCFYRFGVLLAANAQAHRLWPYLPLADNYEQQLAQQLAPLAH